MTKEEFDVLQLELQQSGKSLKDYLTHPESVMTKTA